MARRKPVSEWSESYRNRVLRKLKENPWLTASEATGRKRKPPPPTASSLDIAKYQIRKLKDNLQLKMDLGLVEQQEALEALKRLDSMKKDISTIYERFPPGTRRYYEFSDKVSKNYWWLDEHGYLDADTPEGFIPYR